MQSSWTRNLVWLTAILGAIGLLLYLYVFDTWVVPGDEPALTAALKPTLSPDDRILTRRGSMPKVGELNRCLRPDGSGKYIIGRVFGIIGDEVDIDNERVATNGKHVATRFACGTVPVVHPVSGEEMSLTCSVEDNGAFTYGVLVHPEHREGRSTAKVESGMVFLVSDNRHLHLDSRDFGPVDASTCEHVVFRLWGQSFSDGAHRFNILW